MNYNEPRIGVFSIAINKKNGRRLSCRNIFVIGDYN